MVDRLRRQAAVAPRSCRLNDAISRLRKRHCRPCLKAGKSYLFVAEVVERVLAERAALETLTTATEAAR